jgi:hypothetical protein
LNGWSGLSDIVAWAPDLIVHVNDSAAIETNSNQRRAWRGLIGISAVIIYNPRHA